MQMILIDCGADVNAADNDGNRPLHLATLNGHEDVSAYNFTLSFCVPLSKPQLNTFNCFIVTSLPNA